MIHGLTGNLAVWHLQHRPGDRGPLPRRSPTTCAGTATATCRRRGYSRRRDGRATCSSCSTRSSSSGPSIVGHSYGADIALYFAPATPSACSEVIAIEAALPAMDPRPQPRRVGRVGYWVEALERAGHPVPPERRSDVRLPACARASTCRSSGDRCTACRATRSRSCGCSTRPRCREDYERDRLADARADPGRSRRRWCSCTRSARRSSETHDYLLRAPPEREPIILPRTRVRATSGRSSSPSSSPSTSSHASAAPRPAAEAVDE